MRVMAELIGVERGMGARRCTRSKPTAACSPRAVLLEEITSLVSLGVWMSMSRSLRSMSGITWGISLTSTTGSSGRPHGRSKSTNKTER